MNLTALMAMFCSLAIAGCAILWNRWQAADERAGKAEAALVQMKSNERVVTKYVDRIVEVEKRVPIAVTHIRSLCDGPVSGAGDPDEAAAADARDRQIARLAADLAACRQNADQLSALQEVLRPQVER